MTSVHAAALICPAPTLRPAAAPAAAPAKENKGSGLSADQIAKTADYGSTGTGVVGTILTLHDEALKTTEAIADLSHMLQARAALTVAAGRTGLQSMALSTLAQGSVKVLKGSETITKLASAVAQAPILNKLTQPQVTKVLTDKILPTANAIGSASGFYQNMKRYQRAEATGHTSAQIVSGIQMGLNTLSGTTGFFKGKAQTISAVAGLSSLTLDVVAGFAGWKPTVA
ncbi:MAG: hypothetical protein ACO1RX_20925 [Candidatus Sericytochromatia bacterium]